MLKNSVFLTGSVYGESNQIPTKEDAPFPIQTSKYGASKISAEGLICLSEGSILNLIFLDLYLY